MSEKPPTLSQQVKELQEQVQVLAQPVHRDAEAGVIDRCVRAMDMLPHEPRTTYGYGGTGDRVVSSSSAARVIDYLRQRYGLPDPSTEVRRLEAEIRDLRERNEAMGYRLSQIASNAVPELARGERL